MQIRQFEVWMIFQILFFYEKKKKCFKMSSTEIFTQDAKC